MQVFIVTQDDVPRCATFSQDEASSMFDGIVRSRHYMRANVIIVPAQEENQRVLLQAYQEN